MTPGLQSLPAAVIYGDKKHLPAVAGLLLWGTGGQNLFGKSLFIPSGGEQVDAGLWDAALARRPICVLVLQGREGRAGPMAS